MGSVIGHLDLDYFYAQVEEVENPAIKERPVIVCVFSGRTEDSGVVSTANYRARGLGVSSGMPIVTAKKALEKADPVVIRMERSKYEAVSERVMELLRSQVDATEQTGIDEAFFDITRGSGGDYDSAAETARKIKDSVFQDEHLTCSIGIGRSKVVAKLCSDMAKPGGLVVVRPDSTETFLNGLGVNGLYGVGPKTAKSLGELGIRTVGELAGSDINRLTDVFGRKLGVYLHNAASGADDDPVRENAYPTQFSRIITLKQDTTDAEEVLEQLNEAQQSIAGKLASQGTSFRTLTAIVILTNLSTKTRSKSFETPVNDLNVVGDALLGLFSELSETTDREFRRAGIRVSDLSASRDQKSLGEFLSPL